MEDGTWTLYVDAGVRGIQGELGLSAAGVVLYDSVGKRQAWFGTLIDVRTCNAAEYESLCLGLKTALDHGANKLKVFSDSKLVVYQMNGRWSVRAEHIRNVYHRAKNLAAGFQSIEFILVPRDDNDEADSLVNQAMDDVGDNALARKISSGLDK